jgi:hypothetical protein
MNVILLLNCYASSDIKTEKYYGFYFQKQYKIMSEDLYLTLDNIVMKLPNAIYGGIHGKRRQ